MLRILRNEADEQEDGLSLGLDEIAREGARQMLRQALHAEVAEYIEAHKDVVDEDGRRLVVRNGSSKPRKILLGAGQIELQVPRVNDKRVDEDGERKRYTSKILPRYMRKSPKVAEVIPVLYLRGMSSGHFREALPVLLGKDAAGLSPATITRMTNVWTKDYEQFKRRSLKDKDFVYIWVDGVHFKIRLEDEKLCALVVIGVRPDGQKELIAIEDGYRESTESWASLLRDLKRRGMKAPVLAVGDGALGFWNALGSVWPETEEQRCWVHRIRNVLDKLPKRLQEKAKQALHEIMEAPTKEDAEEQIERFKREYEAKYPKSVESLKRDQDKLLTYFGYPAEHWRHLRTTNVVESPFATVRLRTRVTKGAGSRKKGMLMAFKLLDMAQQRWRRTNGSELLPKVRAGVRFVDGIERVTNQERKVAA
jgi:transposase-like protein